MSRSVFLSFATDAFLENRDRLCSSALLAGFDRAISKGTQDIMGAFWEENAATLSQRRGGGFWLWKPFIIKQVLQELDDDDVLVYSDAGRNDFYRLRRFPSNLINMVRKQPEGFLLGPSLIQHGPLRLWTKRDCLVLLDSDKLEILCKPQIQATWSLWTKSEEAISFLDQWLAFCEDPRCLTDIENTLGLPNYMDFQDHRHDQSILTLLAYKTKAPYLDFSHYFFYRILNLRPQSRLAQLFLKRIDDAENILSGVGFARALLQCYLTILSSGRQASRG